MKKIIFILCLYLQVANAQNNYGEFTYPHSNGSTMSSGITSTVAGQPGFIMAGYNSSAAPYHFTIDRTDKGGAFTGSTFEFQKEYNVFADVTGGCILSNTVPVNSSHAVSIIQTPLSAIGARYALVGAFDEGCYLCFIDGAGSVINSNVFWFPFPAGTNPSTITKPFIEEDPANPGNFYICGSYSNVLYAMKIDYNGLTTWSNTYPISGQPNDMTLSTSGDPVIVGHTTMLNTVPDGFILDIAGTTGNVGASSFKVYDYGNYYQNFSCIERANGSGVGFIIGGTCEISTGIFRAYNLYVDAGLNQTWGNVVQCNADATAANLVGIVERFGFYGWEYFGAITSTAGIIVSRMDNNGVPAWLGPPPPASSRLDEFVYSAPGVNLSATGIFFFNQTVGFDAGLHIFGTDNNSGNSAPYLAQSYFDGHSGCNIPGFHYTTSAISCLFTAPALSWNSGLSPCSAIYILDSPTASKINYCGPNISVANASNAKPSATGVVESQIENDYFIFTNSQNNLVTINCKDCEKISEVSISNLLGETIYRRSTNEIRNENGKINCSDINLQNGVYMINLTTGTGLISKKFTYSKD